VGGSAPACAGPTGTGPTGTTPARSAPPAGSAHVVRGGLDLVGRHRGDGSGRSRPALEGSPNLAEFAAPEELERKERPGRSASAHQHLVGGQVEELHGVGAFAPQLGQGFAPDAGRHEDAVGRGRLKGHDVCHRQPRSGREDPLGGHDDVTGHQQAEPRVEFRLGERLEGEVARVGAGGHAVRDRRQRWNGHRERDRCAVETHNRYARRGVRQRLFQGGNHGCRVVGGQLRPLVVEDLLVLGAAALVLGVGGGEPLGGGEVSLGTGLRSSGAVEDAEAGPRRGAERGLDRFDIEYRRPGRHGPLGRGELLPWKGRNDLELSK